MNQEDIFKLLLIVLLLANKELSRNSDDESETFSYTSLNDILIFFMLLRGFDNGNATTHNNENTTF